MNKLNLYLIFLILLSNCSLVKKNIPEDNKIEKNVFEKIEPIQKELNPTLEIQLTKFTKGNPYLNNNSNNNGNINFESNFKKKYLYTSFHPSISLSLIN